MYSWDEDTSGWYGSAAYSYSTKGATKRKAAAERAKAHGPRTYARKSGPNEKIIDPRKTIRSKSANPLIIAVDVTGSMASWPFEIFDRLPLLYNTLAQYRDDLEICFAAIGDAAVDRPGGRRHARGGTRTARGVRGLPAALAAEHQTAPRAGGRRRRGA